MSKAEVTLLDYDDFRSLISLGLNYQLTEVTEDGQRWGIGYFAAYDNAKLIADLLNKYELGEEK